MLFFSAYCLTSCLKRYFIFKKIFIVEESFIAVMFSNKLLCIIFIGVMCYSAATDDSNCISPLLTNITDQTRSSIVVTLLNNAKNMLEDAKKYAAMKTRCPGANSACKRPMDCAEVREINSSAENGIYEIWPRSRLVIGPVEVYCDMEDDGGAWTVLQRRGDFDSGKEYFYRDWQSYKNGFGSLMKDFWLGNDIIFALTNERLNTIKFTLTDWNGKTCYATYDEFWIDDQSINYTVHVSGYRGTAGDSFSDTNGLPFSTKDQDNDTTDKNCAVEFKGAWWYFACHNSNLNGMYLKGSHASYNDGVTWVTVKGYHYSLKDTVIKIRPKNFQKSSDEVTPL